MEHSAVLLFRTYYELLLAIRGLNHAIFHFSFQLGSKSLPARVKEGLSTIDKFVQPSGVRLNMAKSKDFNVTKFLYIVDLCVFLSTSPKFLKPSTETHF